MCRYRISHLNPKLVYKTVISSEPFLTGALPLVCLRVCWELTYPQQRYDSRSSVGVAVEQMAESQLPPYFLNELRCATVATTRHW